MLQPLVFGCRRRLGAAGIRWTRATEHPAHPARPPLLLNSPHRGPRLTPGPALVGDSERPCAAGLSHRLRDRRHKYTQSTLRARHSPRRGAGPPAVSRHLVTVSTVSGRACLRIASSFVTHPGSREVEACGRPHTGTDGTACRDIAGGHPPGLGVGPPASFTACRVDCARGSPPGRFPLCHPRAAGAAATASWAGDPLRARWDRRESASPRQGYERPGGPGPSLTNPDI